MDGDQKTGDKCDHCKDGILSVSPSGDHLVCRKCGLITLLNKVRSPRGRRQPNRNQTRIFPTMS